MNEVFIIERMIAPGIWELASNTFHTTEKEALSDCIQLMKLMQQTDKGACARVTKLTNVNIKNKQNVK